MRYSKYVVISSVLLFICLGGCVKNKAPESKTQQATPVRVQRVKLQDMAFLLEYVGDIKAQDEAQVFPKVSGKIIEKVKEDGSPVAKGEAIVYIDRDEVGMRFEKAPVVSPIDGIVGRIYVDIGSNVNSQVPVALVVSMDKIKINLDIPEKYLSQVSLNGKAVISVDAYPDTEFGGSISKISPVVDLATRCAPVEITLDNLEHRLKSGMFAKVKLILSEQKNVPVILKESLMGSTPDFYVYVVENNKAVIKKVSLGLRQGPYYQVRDGLREGEPVVIVGQQGLRENAAVSAEEEK
jgi:membrane fusion protein, multidrug efflux system